VLPRTIATVLPNIADLCVADRRVSSLTQMSLCISDNMGLSDALCRLQDPGEIIGGTWANSAQRRLSRRLSHDAARPAEQAWCATVIVRVDPIE